MVVELSSSYANVVVFCTFQDAFRGDRSRPGASLILISSAQLLRRLVPVGFPFLWCGAYSDIVRVALCVLCALPFYAWTSSRRESNSRDLAQRPSTFQRCLALVLCRDSLRVSGGPLQGLQRNFCKRSFGERLGIQRTEDPPMGPARRDLAQQKRFVDFRGLLTRLFHTHTHTRDTRFASYHCLGGVLDRKSVARHSCARYSLIHAVEVEGWRMVCCRNPWGWGCWNGPWSPGSREWEQHPSVAEALNARTSFGRN